VRSYFWGMPGGEMGEREVDKKDFSL